MARISGLPVYLHGRPCSHWRDPWLAHFGLSEASADMIDKHAVTDRTGVEIGLAPHP
ncbi:hypothetical protein [Aurantiacibacter sp. MUD61]|uniref:hypothetical protein n=1 Tax=Aurantiacibacter sp. MUD61 TaxID=3009083 RepID=UPI0022F07BDF|nr:hypothetical protein [Aurantiacibacter sp. MUD61]